jgi:hypothetical protein
LDREDRARDEEGAFFDAVAVELVFELDLPAEETDFLVGVPW